MSEKDSPRGQSFLYYSCMFKNLFYLEVAERVAGRPSVLLFRPTQKNLVTAKKKSVNRLLIRKCMLTLQCKQKQKKDKAYVETGI